MKYAVLSKLKNWGDREHDWFTVRGEPLDRAEAEAELEWLNSHSCSSADYSIAPESEGVREFRKVESLYQAMEGDYPDGGVWLSDDNRVLFDACLYENVQIAVTADTFHAKVAAEMRQQAAEMMKTADALEAAATPAMEPVEV